MKNQVKKFDLFYTIKFVHKNNNQIKLWFARPVKSKYQKIVSFQTNLRSTKKYCDDQQNRILYFDLKYKNDFDVNLAIELSKDGELVSKNWSLVKDSNLKNYLKSESFLEQTPAIKKLTKEITREKKNLYDKVRAVFDFVVDNFKYQYPVKKRGVKHLNLKNLCGDCGEYGTMLVTMLRILGIPAKNQTGFVICQKQKKVLEHSWVSAYFKNIGWLDFDPQYADIEKNKDKYFGRRSDYRIVFTNGFNIPIKPDISPRYTVDFWHKAGLPMTRKSVQVLQPAVFVSKNKIEFRDKFTIKNRSRWK
ncbi:transglutaminase-like domain-containing protein [Patescibacteria group bacterium]|nr:transglutaminase-like domain-containing protein [Patescibacteria group bacterium]